MNKDFLFKLMNIWPPFIGAGIRVKKISADYTAIDVEMKVRFWNRNYVGSAFGGSLYAMTDPFYMLILKRNLGPDYIVWDKAATIRFKKPGYGRLKSHFSIPKVEIEAIRTAADNAYKTEPIFTAQITDESGDVVAEIEKLLYVRNKINIPRKNTI